jgi:hypothetical protein
MINLQKNFVAVLILLVLVFSFNVLKNEVLAEDIPINKTEEINSVDLELNGFNLNIETNFLPSNIFDKDDPEGVNIVATSESHNPYKHFSIKSLPFGSRSSIEDLKLVDGGKVIEIKEKFNRLRTNESKLTRASPEIEVFGKRIIGTMNVIDLPVDTLVVKPTLILEWVVPYAENLWIIRTAQALNEDDQEVQIENFVKQVAKLKIKTKPEPNAKVLQNVPANLPNPPWWSLYTTSDPYKASDRDACNVNNHSGSYRLSGNSYGSAIIGNVPACGPGPTQGGSDVLVSFTGGGAAYQWECVEYSMRWVKLTYGEPTWNLNGKASRIVVNYPVGQSGRNLIPVSNGSVGQSPQPGDVLGHGAITDVGHTSVVKENHVNSDGTGYVIVVQQNDSNIGGVSRINMGTPWYLNGINGWLRDPNSFNPCEPNGSDWIISNGMSCEINSPKSFSGNVTIQNGGQLTIKPNGALDLDLQVKKMQIQSQGKLLIENGGKIY